METGILFQKKKKSKEQRKEKEPTLLRRVGKKM